MATKVKNKKVSAPEVLFKVHDIRAISLSYINISNDMKSSFNDSDDFLTVGVNAKFQWDLKEELFKVLIHCEYNYKYKEKEINLLRVECVTTYKIINLSSIIALKGDNQFKMPPDLMLILVGSALSHARAIISEKTQGSFVHTIQIP